MIIDCPNCTKRFQVDDNALGQGRNVRCGHCGHVWFQTPAFATAPGQTGESTSPADAPSERLAEQSEPAPPLAAETRVPPAPPPPEPPAPAPPADLAPPPFIGHDDRIGARPTERGKRPPRPGERSGDRGGGWMGAFALLLLIVLFVAGAVEFRGTIIKYFPESRTIYDTFGLPLPDPTEGLVVTSQQFTPVDGEDAIVITGDIVNQSNELRELPNVHVVLKNEGGQTIGEQTLPVVGPKLTPTEQYGFELRYDRAPAEVATVTLSLVAAP